MKGLARGGGGWRGEGFGFRWGVGPMLIFCLFVVRLSNLFFLTNFGDVLPLVGCLKLGVVILALAQRLGRLLF